MSRDIYIAIMVADAKGNGLRLTAEQVGDLAMDEAIRQAAMNGLAADEWPQDNPHAEPDWKRIKPFRDRTAANLACRAPEDVAAHRCPTCHRCDAEYRKGVHYCRDPWHGDDHLRRSAALIGENGQ